MTGDRYPDAPLKYDPEWAQQLIRDLEQRAVADAQPFGTGYEVSNYTRTTTLDMSTAGATEIGNFICTLVDDLKSIGKLKN